MIIVAGITRSGLTLTMQMLQAGGVKCAGDHPAFECYDVGQIPWYQLDGYAVKAVDTHLQNPPSKKCRVIRLRRNLIEQCRSINKFNNFFGIPSVNENALKASLIRDYRKIDAWADSQHALFVDFESLIRNPLTASVRISQFLDMPLDIGAMKSVVVKRDTACFDGLLELSFFPDRQE